MLASSAATQPVNRFVLQVSWPSHLSACGTLLDQIEADSSHLRKGRQQPSSSDAAEQLQKLRAVLGDVQAGLENMFAAGEALPETTWKQLINDKAAYRLGIVCCKLLPTPSKASPAPAASISARTTTQLLLILHKFTAMWQTSQVIVLSGAPSKLALSIGQQFQQSGLLPKLQRLLANAAERLEAVLPPAPIHSQTSSTQAAAAASNTGQSAISRSSSAADGLTAQQHDQLQQETLALLSLYTSLQCFWPNTVFVSDVAPECAAPAMRLVCLSAQYMGSLLATGAAGPAGKGWGLSNFSEQLWQLSTIWLMGSQAAMSALGAAYFWTGKPAANSAQLRVQLGLYTSAHYLPCVVLMMACHAYSNLLLHLPALPRADTTDGTAKSRGRGSQAAGAANLPMESPADAAKLWQFAQEQQQALPASHRKLFELLGLDSNTVVWLGAVLAGNIQEMPEHSMAEKFQMASGRLERTISQFLQLRELHTDPDYKHTAVGRALLSKPALAWQQEQQLHYLLPSLLLYWTAEQPALQPGGGQPADAYLAVSCSLSALRTARRDLSRASFAEQQQKSPGQQSAEHSPSVELQLLLMRDVLPLAVRTGLKLTALLPSDGKSGSSTAAAAAGSHPLASAQLTDTQAATANILSILSTLALSSNMRFMTQSQLLKAQMDSISGSSAGSTSSTAGGSTATAGSTSSSTGGSTAGVSADSTSIYAPAAVTDIWAPHAVAVGRIAEVYVRNVALRGMAWASAERDLLPKMSQLVSFTPGYTLSPLLQAAVTADSGNPEQLQLFSLLCTWGKAGQGLEGVNQCFRVVSAMLRLSVTAREAPEDGSTRKYVWQRTADTELSRALGLPEVGTDTVSMLLRSSTATVSGGTSSAGAAGADGELAMVPWLVLFGRSLHDCSQLLLVEARKLRMVGSMGGFGALAESLAGLQANLAAVREEQGGPNEMLTVPAECCGYLSVCSSACQLVEQWLQAPGRLPLLFTAGFCEVGLSAQIGSLLGSIQSGLKHLEGSMPGRRVTVSKGKLQQLWQLGEALNSLAMPCACNNPLCRNLSGPTELELVGSRSCKCSGCRAARYCGKECQRQHWKQHKPVCKAIGAHNSSTAGR